MSGVKLSNLVKRYGNIQVVHGIDLDIAPQEFVVLVGPSGCGKSTTLRMIAGLEEITSGVLTIDDQIVNRVAPKDRDVAMVFQNYALYPHLNVFDNIAFGLRIRKESSEHIKKTVKEVSNILGLTPYLERRPADLSGGQRQRVAMGRAIVRRPKVFLFDEPLSNLDAKLRTQMRAEIKRLHKRLGATSIYVTHDQIEAMTMADRMIVMNEGVAEQIGSPLEVYERPQTLFAAQFIGSPAMNIFDANLESGKLGMDNNVTLSCNSDYTGKIKLGIRPEHLVQDSNGPISFVPALAEPLGANTLVHGKLEGNSESITVSLPGVHALQANVSGIRLSVDPANLHLFDASTGDRI